MRYIKSYKLFEMKSFDSDDYKESINKFNTFGPLGVTAEDHLNIGSTPNNMLINNPNKTLGEIMSREEIYEWLRELENEINKYSSYDKNNSFIQSILSKYRQDLILSKNYLKTLNKYETY